MNVRVVATLDEADPNSLQVELFRDGSGVVRGWYIGPLVRTSKEFVLPFTPRDQHLPAETAIIRVVEMALAAELNVSLIDPDRLWSELKFHAPRPPNRLPSP